MFSLVYGFWLKFFEKVEHRVLILGVDDAGKTTLLERIKVEHKVAASLKPDSIMPTVGLNSACFDASAEAMARPTAQRARERERERASERTTTLTRRALGCVLRRCSCARGDAGVPISVLGPGGPGEEGPPRVRPAHPSPSLTPPNTQRSLIRLLAYLRHTPHVVLRRAACVRYGTSTTGRRTRSCS